MSPKDFDRARVTIAEGISPILLRGVAREWEPGPQERPATAAEVTAMSSERAGASRERAVALVEEAHDLTRWLGVAPEASAGVLVAAAAEAAARDWRHPRRLEVALLGTVAARSIALRSRSWARVPPRLSSRALHPSSTALSPAGSVDALADTAREVLALLPPDDAVLAPLSVRYGFDHDEVAWLLSVSRRRARNLVEHARSGFAGTAGAVVLWNGGEPRCIDLRSLVVLAGVEELGNSGARLLVDHAEVCRECNSALWQVTEVLSVLATAAPEPTPSGVAASAHDPVASLAARPLRP